MYFTNIANDELQYFHGQYAPNFSISLTDVLQSSLFQVEELVQNTLYRIYPLFYAKTIQSNHNNDKILGNQCIIATKQENKETYFRFISNEGIVIAYNELFEYYTVNDKLSVAEFNSIVQQFRSTYPFSENITISNSRVTGTYASYIFNLESTTIVDTGVLITKETLDNIGTVRLINPVFEYSTYTLVLKVYTVEDINIALSSKNNIEVTTLEVELIKDTDVQIPFETLDLNNIVGFDATVNIVHDKPVIQYPLNLTVSSSSYNPVLSKITVLTCRSLDEAGDPIPNESITFKTLEGTVLGTSTTDNEGYASLDYTPTSTGEIVIYCVDNYQNKSNNISLNRILQSSSITLTSDKSLVYIPSTFKVSGTLIIDGDPAKNTEIKLYNNNTLYETLTTDENGAFSKTITQSSEASYQLQAKYNGTEYIDSSNSSYVNVTCRKLNTNLSISTDKSTVYHTQSLAITGTLTDELGNPISGATVVLKGGSADATRTTDTNGAYRFGRNYSSSDYGTTFNYYVTYFGDNSHEECSSSTKSVQIRKAPTSVNIIATGTSYNTGDTVLIKVNTNYGTLNPSSVNVAFNGTTTSVTTKDSSGNFVFTIPVTPQGNYSLTATYPGDSNYESSSSSKTIPIRVPSDITLSLSYASGKFILNAKSGGVNLKNTNLEGVILQIMNPRVTFEPIGSDITITDSNGNITFPFSGISSFHGTAYVTFTFYDGNAITSNTVGY
nr:hypothetical protein [uncultured Methanobrevibacter sp.]